MPSPYPGMDPYLEDPMHWRDVHLELISSLRAVLKERIPTRYFVRIQERTYLSNAEDPGFLALAGGIEVTLIDDQIHEAYLEVLDISNDQVVTVIEMLSPANKVPGAKGLESLAKKRSQILRSSTHWVEIDLLREGVSPIPPAAIPQHEYFVHVSPTNRRPEGLVWPILLSQRLPVIPIPLRSGDDDAPLDLQAVLNTAYDHAGYDTDIDYTKAPVPPLSPQWAEWSDRWLREKGLRRSESAG